MKALLEKIRDGHVPDEETLAKLIALGSADAALREHAAGLARNLTESAFGDGVFIRGLVEISSYCGNDCYYCGIRRGNERAQRYRLTRDEILERCAIGHQLGFRTFVLQGGEDAFFTDAAATDIVAEIRRRHPDSAITLSLGERTRESYERLFAAGADRYLLRHETADAEFYARIHPPGMTLDSRVRCLYDLKAIGFQVGSGFIIGAPFQTPLHLARDMLFLKRLDPAMVGLGPFIPHRDTPFAAHPAGTVEATLFLLSLTRLMLPRVLLPATTALGTVAPDGRERGILAGANVVMPNLSPADAREKYTLYNGKLTSNAEAAENLAELAARLAAIGRRIVVARGDYDAAKTG